MMRAHLEEGGVEAPRDLLGALRTARSWQVEPTRLAGSRARRSPVVHLVGPVAAWPRPISMSRGGDADMRLTERCDCGCEWCRVGKHEWCLFNCSISRRVRS